jgi:hypothetical protein
VDLRYLHGSDLSKFFEKWLSEFPEPYQQRYRKQITYSHVAKHGTLLMTIEHGEVTYPRLKPGE